MFSVLERAQKDPTWRRTRRLRPQHGLDTTQSESKWGKCHWVRLDQPWTLKTHVCGWTQRVEILPLLYHTSVLSNNASNMDHKYSCYLLFTTCFGLLRHLLGILFHCLQLHCVILYVFCLPFFRVTSGCESTMWKGKIIISHNSTLCIRQRVCVSTWATHFDLN